ncbi:PspC domain-containing protein [Streptomyces sp. OfavH-34-F]|uniref:PspC domain-containing protein n=1 Tax=Streptomyces sp. OfavH-34-F TaxID=2917760 RepID=UPI001EF36B92|nr:PspC domain-containing protein [Streptomyces sp. OfavH-34-F]MCG7526485.1 PspC domain-containing protein [Streptomyces sp. OfavH-34-F]
MTVPQDAPPGAAPPPAPAPRLHRSPRHKVVAGVCGGLGRYCDVDPVIFRIVLGVLSVTGGFGLIFYGFAWLLIPLEGEDENEARRLLSGRVELVSLSAVLLALIGCGLFLSMLGNGGTLAFSAMLSVAVLGFSIWTQARKTADPEDPLRQAAAQAASDAPPEVKAPPTLSWPSWWRDPIVKDGSTGKVAIGYMWGPPDATLAGEPRGATPDAPFRPPPPRSREVRGPRSIAGVAFLVALVAGGIGTGLSWDAQPLGTSLQIGLTAALAVFGLAMLISAFIGRTGFGTLLLAVLTAGLLAGASALPKDISTHWVREEWRPATAAAVQPRYAVGSGQAELDLAGVAVPKGETVRTRVEARAGRVLVHVPPEVTVRVHARTKVGALVLIDGRHKGDLDIRAAQDQRRTIPPVKGSPPGGTIELDLEVDYGQVEVNRAAS